MRVRHLLEGDGLWIGAEASLTVLKITGDVVLLEITDRGVTRVEALSVAGGAGDTEGAAKERT